MAGVKLHSSSVSPLLPDKKYTLTAVQSITYRDARGLQNDKFSRSVSFKTASLARYSLDPALIQSVYPPPAHSDFWFTLPHVLFQNAQVPWNFPVGRSQQPRAPYLALLVFKDAELAIDAGFQQELKTKLEATEELKISATRSVRLPIAQIFKYWKSTTIPEAYSNSKQDAQVIFLDKLLYSTLFSARDEYSLTSHVRTVDLSEASGIGSPGSTGTFAVTLSRRCGPSDISSPVLVHAHLVALPDPVTPGLDDLGSRKAVVSLYSWSYTCLPSLHFSLVDAFRNLRNSLGPLRSPMYKSSSAPSDIDVWTSSRIATGYTIARYVPVTGESAMCIYRSMLSPVPHIDDGVPPSDNGEDLMILDQTVGLPDVTYQLAWQLGRLQCISDPEISAAVMRLRGMVHKLAVSMTKTSMDDKFVTIGSALQHMNGDLSQLCSPVLASPQSMQTRWKTPGLAPGLRSHLSFRNEEVQEEYVKILPRATDRVIIGPPDYNMRMTMNVVGAPKRTNIDSGHPTSLTSSATPESSDFEVLSGWLLDRVCLKKIPWYNLISDPILCLPQESIKTFYIDNSWLQAFTDGALSVGEHFTVKDEARECIKVCLHDYMAARKRPIWGFIIRSDLVTKFPNMEISAPTGSGTKFSTEPMLAQQVDAKTLLVLYDRGPGSFPQGINIQPPGHQLHFSLGDSGSWTMEGGTVNELHLPLRAVSLSDGRSVKPSEPYTMSYTRSGEQTASSGFDFASNLLIPSQVSRDISLKIRGAETSPSSALLGSQLIAQTPFLNIPDASPNHNAGLNVKPSSASPFISNVKRPEPTRVKPRLNASGSPKSAPVAANLLVETNLPDADIPIGTANTGSQALNSLSENTMPFLEQLMNLNWTNQSLVDKYLNYNSGQPVEVPSSRDVAPSLHIPMIFYNAQTMLSSLWPHIIRPYKRHLYALVAPTNAGQPKPLRVFGAPTDLYISIYPTSPLAQHKSIKIYLNAADPDLGMPNALLCPPRYVAPSEAKSASESGLQMPVVTLAGAAARYLSVDVSWWAQGPPGVLGGNSKGQYTIVITQRPKAGLDSPAMASWTPSIDIKIARQQIVWSGRVDGPRAAVSQVMSSIETTSNPGSGIFRYAAVSVYAFDVQKGAVLGVS